MDTGLSKFQEMGGGVGDREAWRAAVHGDAKSQAQLNWTRTIKVSTSDRCSPGHMVGWGVGCGVVLRRDIHASKDLGLTLQVVLSGSEQPSSLLVQMPWEMGTPSYPPFGWARRHFPALGGLSLDPPIQRRVLNSSRVAPFLIISWCFMSEGRAGCLDIGASLLPSLKMASVY